MYGYLIDNDFHATTNVIISPHSVKLVIPKNVVEMTMQEAKLIAMVKCLNSPVPDILKGIDKMAINCKMTITKHESIASELKLGYLVLQRQLGEEAGIARIKQLLKGTPILNNQVVVYEDHQEFLYLDDPAKLQVNQTGEFTSEFKTPHVPLELGKKYHVYACVILDGHDLFISKNEVKMDVPKVDLTITRFESKKDKKKLLTESEGKIKVHVDFQEPEQDNARTTGYIIYPYAGVTIPDDMPQLQAVMNVDTLSRNSRGNLRVIVSHAFEVAEDLKNGKVQDPEESAVLSFPGTFVVFSEDIPGAQSSESTYGKAFDGIKEGTEFQVAKVWCHGNVVFIKQAEDHTQLFTWYKVDKPEEPFTPITLADGTTTDYLYRHDEAMTKAELRKKVDEKTEKLVKLSDTNRAEIENLLKNIFKAKNQKWVDDSIRNFMNVMEKEPVNP